MILLLSRLKNQFQDLMVEILYFLGSLREMDLSKCFLLVVFFECFDKYDLYLSTVFHLFMRFSYSVDFVYFMIDS